MLVTTRSGLATFETPDRAAVRSVAAWTFEPGLERGRPVERWIRVPVGYRLRGS